MMPFDPATIDVDALLKRLHLANARRCWRQLTEQAATDQWTPATSWPSSWPRRSRIGRASGCSGHGQSRLDALDA